MWRLQKESLISNSKMEAKLKNFKGEPDKTCRKRRASNSGHFYILNNQLTQFECRSYT
jgi:hypothetical protein